MSRKGTATARAQRKAYGGAPRCRVLFGAERFVVAALMGLAPAAEIPPLDVGEDDVEGSFGADYLAALEGELAGAKARAERFEGLLRRLLAEAASGSLARAWIEPSLRGLLDEARCAVGPAE